MALIESTTAAVVSRLFLHQLPRLSMHGMAFFRVPKAEKLWFGCDTAKGDTAEGMANTCWPMTKSCPHGVILESEVVDMA
jgi:hypothetical protein